MRLVFKDTIQFGKLPNHQQEAMKTAFPSISFEKEGIIDRYDYDRFYDIHFEKSNRDKVYIAGKITGLEKDICWNNFKKVEEAIENISLIPINPLRVQGINSIECYQNHEPRPWDSYLRRDIKALMDCNRMFVQPNWIQSKGAELEMHIAKILDIKIIYLK